jgi:hypothetical protein
MIWQQKLPKKLLRKIVNLKKLPWKCVTSLKKNWIKRLIQQK